MTTYIFSAFSFFSCPLGLYVELSRKKDIIMVNFKGSWGKNTFFNYVYTEKIQLVIENQVRNLGFSFVNKKSVISEYKSRHISDALL